jgi:hypothetical protein
MKLNQLVRRTSWGTVNQLRPRLTREEAKFIAVALRLQESVAKQKQKEMLLREARIRRLKRQFIVTSNQQTLSTLRSEQQLLMKDRVAKYHRQQRVAEVLARRFDLLLQGKVKHSANITSYFLGTRNV